MSVVFNDAVRRDGALLIIIAGGTGAGKTESAMRLATGLAGGKKFGVIDTETGRALHKADDYNFAHADLDEPYTPERCGDAIKAADAQGFPVIVFDSGSHEYEGIGGLLEIQEEEFKRLGERDGARMTSWIVPKRRHKKGFVQPMLKSRAHIILCLRAEDKIEVVKVDGKTVVRPKESLVGANGWIPICEKRLPFEASMSFLVTADAPGIPKPIKLEKRFAPFVPLDKPLSEDTGKQLAAWAAGTSVSAGEPQGIAATTEPAAVPSDARTGEAAQPSPADAPPITDPQKKKLDVLVAQLRKAEKINASQLWRSTHREPVKSEDGEVHWSPLRDSLSKDEASALIERLSKYAENLGVAA